MITVTLTREELAGACKEGLALLRGAYLRGAHRLRHPPASWAPDRNGYLNPITEQQ